MKKLADERDRNAIRPFTWAPVGARSTHEEDIRIMCHCDWVSFAINVIQ